MKALCSPATSATIYHVHITTTIREDLNLQHFSDNLHLSLLIVFLCPLQEYFVSWFLCSPDALCFMTHISQIYTQLCSLQIWVFFLSLWWREIPASREETADTVALHNTVTLATCGWPHTSNILVMKLLLSIHMADKSIHVCNQKLLRSLIIHDNTFP